MFAVDPTVTGANEYLSRGDDDLAKRLDDQSILPSSRSQGVCLPKRNGEIFYPSLLCDGIGDKSSRYLVDRRPGSVARRVRNLRPAVD